jgi:fucose permease
VLFLIRTRHANPTTAASASSIFWLGMALGRYALGAVTEAIGLHTAVSTYIAMACCAQFLLMGLHQIAGNLVVLGVCGFFLAPLFPSGIVMLANRTPIQDRTEVIAAVIAMGQVGVAIVPYAMGLLATHLGTQYLLHVTLGLSVVLLILWIAISRLEETRKAVESIDSDFTTSGSIVD